MKVIFNYQKYCFAHLVIYYFKLKFKVVIQLSTFNSIIIMSYFLRSTIRFMLILSIVMVKAIFRSIKLDFISLKSLASLKLVIRMIIIRFIIIIISLVIIIMLAISYSINFCLHFNYLAVKANLLH